MEKLNIPKKELNNIEWYKQYHLLSSSLFLYDNSARKTQLPYIFLLKNGKLEGMKYIKGIVDKYKIIGYSLNPPIKANYDAVAIMIEHQETFEKTWFHYMRYE